jgi:DNA-binding CsgD family transcriptional regulator
MSHIQLIIELIQTSALDPRRWPEVLDAMSRLIDAEGASLVAQDRHTHRMDGAAVGDHATALKEYGDYYGRINPVWPPTFAASAGEVLIDREIVGTSDFERTEFFNDFCIPHQLHSSLAVKVLNTPLASAVVSLSRRATKPVFGRAEGRLLEYLAPHLKHALAVSQSLAEVRSLTSGLMAALHLLPHGAMLVDGHARVKFANGAAEALLQQRDGVSLGPEGLQARNAEDTQILRSQIAYAARQRSAGSDLLLTRPGRRPLRLQTVPCRPHADERDTWSLVADPQGLVLLLMFDDAEAKYTAPEILRRRFGLTHAEANLAMAIVDGQRLKVVAQQQDISLATAKTHLQRVFEKTDTHRQVELVRLLLMVIMP